jgi:hypothetical protein
VAGAGGVRCAGHALLYHHRLDPWRVVVTWWNVIAVFAGIVALVLMLAWLSDWLNAPRRR